MRLPQDQAAFFRLLSNVLYYIVSGSTRVGVLAAQPWNPHYHPNPDTTPEEPEDLDLQIEVWKCYFAADPQTRPIYDYIPARPFGEEPILFPIEKMDTRGVVVHDESDADDSDLDEDEWREAIEAAQVQDSAPSSRDSREGNAYFVAVK